MIIVGILLLGLLLRLINLNQSLWLDEAVQAITAQNSLSHIFLEIRGDFHPPLYYFLMNFWVRIFGSSEVSLRMPSVLFGVGTVYFTYLIAKIIFPRTHYSLFFVHCSLPDLVALLLATAPFHVYYSQEARMYSMTCFFATLSMFFFLRINELIINGLKDSKVNELFVNGLTDLKNYGIYILYFMSTILMLYSDYYGFLILLVQGIYLLTRKKYKFLFFNSCLPVGMALFIILCYLPWLPMLFTQLKTGVLATQTLPGWGSLVNVSFLKAIPLTFIKFSIGRILIFNKTIYAGVAGVVIGIYGFLIVRAIRGWIRDGLKDSKGVIVTWFLVPLLTAWLLSLAVPNFQPFRLLLILPAFYLLVTRGISVIKSGRVRALAIVLVLILNLYSLSVYFFNPFFQREDWRGLTSFLKNQNGAQVILPSANSDWPIKYYDQRNEIRLLSAGHSLGEIKDVLEISRNLQTGKVFFIRYLVPLYDPQELILEEINKSGYTKAREISFNQIPVWEFEKK